MKKLINSLKEDKKKYKISNKQIAYATNLSQATISNYFNNAFRIPFHKFVEILHIIYRNHEYKIDKRIHQYLLKIDKIDYIKEAIEWFFTNGENKKAHELIMLHLNNDPSLELYKILSLRAQRSIKKEDFYRELELIKRKKLDEETIALAKIAEMYNQLDFKSFIMLDFLANEAISTLKNISNEYFKKTFELRILEMKALTELMRDNVENAREICNRVIANYDSIHFPIPLSSFYNILSESYIFEDYEKALKYNKIAFNIISQTKGECESRKNILESTHDFMKIYHNDFENLYLTSLAEKAYYFAETNKGEEAITLLNEIEMDSGVLSAFQLYYKSIATKDENIRQLARDKCIQSGNYFYSKIMAEEKNNKL
jgi:transcriptional regulator with XRE-family HTH domain